MSNAIWTILQALAAQLAAITVAGGYNTDIGRSIVLYDQQRDSTDRPSIAIGSRAGKIDRSDQTGPDGRALSRCARQIEIVIEAGLSCAPEDAERIAHDAREDIETVYHALLKTHSALPTGVSRFSLTDWTILDRPDGIDACVLRITGVVEYLRAPT